MKNFTRIDSLPFIILLLTLIFPLVLYAQESSYEWAEKIGGSLLDESFAITSDFEGNSIEVMNRLRLTTDPADDEYPVWHL